MKINEVYRSKFLLLLLTLYATESEVPVFYLQASKEFTFSLNCVLI